MGLPVLALQAVILIRKVSVGSDLLHGSLCARPAVLLVLLQRLLVHLLQLVQRHLQIRHESIASAAREILAHHHTHHLELLRVWSHGVSRHDPAAFTQTVSDGELVEFVVLRRVEAEGNEWETFAAGLGHEEESHLLDRRGEIVGGAGEVEHDATIALLSQADELVVLSNDLTSATREVQREGCLIRAKVVDVEDELWSGRVSTLSFLDML